MRRFLGRLFQEPHKVFWKFLQCLFVWGRPRARGNLLDGQIILTQAFCDLAGGRISTTNKALASFVGKLWQESNLPVYPQGEMATAMREICVPVIAQTRLISVNEVFKEGYFGSYEVALEQKLLCDKMGLTRIVVVAYV